jgi:hypothetical protein
MVTILDVSQNAVVAHVRHRIREGDSTGREVDSLVVISQEGARCTLAAWDRPEAGRLVEGEREPRVARRPLRIVRAGSAWVVAVDGDSALSVWTADGRGRRYEFLYPRGAPEYANGGQSPGTVPSAGSYSVAHPGEAATPNRPATFGRIVAAGDSTIAVRRPDLEAVSAGSAVLDLLPLRDGVVTRLRIPPGESVLGVFGSRLLTLGRDTVAPTIPGPEGSEVHPAVIHVYRIR